MATIADLAPSQKERKNSSQALLLVQDNQHAGTTVRAKSKRDGPLSMAEITYESARQRYVELYDNDNLKEKVRRKTKTKGPKSNY
jgi:hypothetical protein